MATCSYHPMLAMQHLVNNATENHFAYVRTKRNVLSNGYEFGTVNGLVHLLLI